MQKVTISLYEGDMHALQSFYRETGASKIIRILVRDHVANIEAAAPPTPKLEVTI